MVLLAAVFPLVISALPARGAEGDLDTASFGFVGDGGIAYTCVASSGDSGVAVATQSDGKILLAGVDSLSHEAFVERFDSNGTRDTVFGSLGIAHTGISSSGYSGVGVAIQSDDKILLAGEDGSRNEHFVARFLGTPVPVTPLPTLNAPGFVLAAFLMLLTVALVAGKKKRRFAASA